MECHVEGELASVAEGGKGVQDLETSVGDKGANRRAYGIAIGSPSPVQKAGKGKDEKIKTNDKTRQEEEA